jgi:hypothetical protein
MNFFRVYKYCLLKHPIKTKALTNGIIYSLADATCQEIENKYNKDKNNKKYEYNITRTFVFWLFGTFMSGPANHLWMNRLNKIGKNLVFTKKYSKNKANVIMVSLDQLLYSPIYSITFYTFAHYLNEKLNNKENKSNKIIFNESIYHTKKIFPITYSSEFLFWPFIQFINFKYININYRVLFMSKCNLLWSIFTSYMVNN